MILKAIAIDDEPLGLEIIERFAGKVPNVELLKTFQNPLEAAAYLQENAVDLMFLDIQMPDLSGLQFLKTLSEPPMVVFTTAYSEYAVDSYELNAVDYLLKPILFDRFVKAVNKAQSQLKAEDALKNQELAGEDESQEYLFIKSDTRFFKVNYEDIRYIEGMRDYIAVHTPTQKILTLMSMTNMLKKLPVKSFMRVHKSYIVGLDHISLIQHNRIYIGDKEIPISNSYKEAFLKFVEGMGR
ncbi:LytTR family DNA-binding domain-containing protein [Pontibacter sp. G13]|uniref:LytR/AlgR family response regulator transcription factor n=1 Tax=Pontibacter sp. G13 TaxID=3074898 RepID=UPI00288A42F0|nr:LytTR family DNA-binding domain-containing protein [Pontibacter sp. G13]WNJ19541.1 LytTR family DNA-binding domain-containing protein [Pontibacter sp. G13]